MAEKTLSFGAENVTTSAGANRYISVEIETDYPDEIINEFKPAEIISEYADLEELYDALKEHLGKD